MPHKVASAGGCLRPAKNARYEPCGFLWMLPGHKESSTRTAVIAGAVDTLITLAALLAAQSSVLLADFLKTGLDFIAVLLAWLAMRHLARGAGDAYDYGIGKLENLSSLIVAA